MLRQDTEDFMRKAREFGLIEEMDRELELRKNEERLTIIAELAALPPVEKTDIPALSKAATASLRALELAQEAYKKAERDYKKLSIQLYGIELEFEGARNLLKQRARELAPQFIRDACDDLSVLDGLAQTKFAYAIETMRDGWLGRAVPVSTSNGTEVQACRKVIADTRTRLQEMVLEPTAFEESQAEAIKLVSAAKEAAFLLGVDRQEFSARRKQRGLADKTEAPAGHTYVRRAKNTSTSAA